MIKSFTTEAIVLSRKNIGESDKLLTLFTRFHGKRKVIAKGIRKIQSRRAPYVEPFSHIRAVLYKSKSWEILTEVTSLEFFPFAKSRLERIAFMYTALELTDRLTAEHQEQREVFEHLLNFLHVLNNAELKRNQATDYLLHFKQKLVTELGFNTLAFSDNLRVDNVITDLLSGELRSDKLLARIQSG